MKNIKIETILTIMIMVAAITASHFRLGGKVDVLAATNTIEHKQFRSDLNELTLAFKDGSVLFFADHDDIAKRKKSYAGTPDGAAVYIESE